MLKKEWFWAAVGGGCAAALAVAGLAKAVGFQTPQAQVEAIKATQQEHTLKLAKHDDTLTDHTVQLAVVNQKLEILDLLKVGMEEQLGHKLKK